MQQYPSTARGPKPPPQAAPSRMTLASIVRGKVQKPLRVTVFGVEGIGKSTFGASAPKAIFLGAEDGTAHLDVARFPMPEDLTFKDVQDALQTLMTEAHDFGTLVIDTADWLEPLIWAHICKRDSMKSIEDYGYGKGYVAALDEWRVLLAQLDRLRETKRMHIVVLAHSWVKPFKNPEGDDFDRYEMKLHAKAGGLLKEWCDAVLFANWETYANKDSKTKKVKGVSTGARLLYTVRTAAYDAKNRFNLPESIPLDWREFFQAATADQPADLETLRTEIERKAAELVEADRDAALSALGRAGDDVNKLVQLNNWVNAKRVQKDGQ